eukprot:GHVL01012618.1.p1 GENE.GHVL01012618.1~~GHVL01012618.1.p1  ORF type:complete len:520 (+),score=86.62 GHVL01012618.1:57-1616(+)
MTDLARYSYGKVAKQCTSDSCWIIIDSYIYDVTKFLSIHPGGRCIILRYGGKDCTKEFHSLHSSSVLKKYQKLCIGVLEGVEPISRVRKAPEQDDPEKYFGDLIPFGDPSWYQGWNSPYYNESHKKFRNACRDWIETNIMPYVQQWDEARKIPLELFKKAGDFGMLTCSAGPAFVAGATRQLPGGIKPDEFDAFHELILVDELSRTGSGVVWGLTGGLGIGLPPVALKGPPHLAEKVKKECLSGEKIICLCITEPYAGSDVANLQTMAKKSDDGRFYYVTGEKKWITNGVTADYFTVAVRTGGAGMNGVSVLLLDRSMPGIETKQMKCTGVWPSGTTYITFDNVKVPVENLIGKENKGFKVIMNNFNHERFGFIIQSTRLARVCVEESFKYAVKRETFNKRLIDHPVIRAKLGEMIGKVECCHAYMENIAFQMNTMHPLEQEMKLAGPLALLKVEATRTLERCAREAVQIFGGNGYTRGGQGEKVERIYREVKALAIPGGSEEVMIDLGVRQSIKLARL